MPLTNHIMKRKRNTLAIVACCLLIQMDQAGAATMFSNLGQEPVGSLAIASDSWRAEGFYTGTDTNGYLLNSIQLQFGTPIGLPSGLRLGIYDRNGVIPGNSLETLAGAEPSGSGVFTFQSSGLLLHPNRAYFIVVTATTPLAAGAYQWEITSWVDQAHVFGFSAGGLLYHSSDGLAWTYSRPNNFIFAIDATVIPEPSSLVLYLCGGALWLAAWVRRHTGCAVKRPVLKTG